MRREMLNLTVEREFLQRLLAAGHAFDLEREGLYDARSGLVNIWCSPDDKPPCWDAVITRGGVPLAEMLAARKPETASGIPSGSRPGRSRRTAGPPTRRKAGPNA
jgi:hypothetical protein